MYGIKVNLFTLEFSAIVMISKCSKTMKTISFTLLFFSLRHMGF